MVKREDRPMHAENALLALAEVQTWLRQVDGSAAQIGWQAGASRYEVTLFDHPNERCWTGEAEEVSDAIDHALDLWHVKHPGQHAPVGGEDPRYPDPASRAERVDR
jgi:hypothetical protein